MTLKLYNANEDESIDIEKDVVVYMDGIRHIVGPGETVTVPVGSSITLTQYMYHSFWAPEDEGDLIVGEVASVNDDNTDNRLNPEMPRFGDIIEDEEAVHPLCNEYNSLY